VIGVVVLGSVDDVVLVALGHELAKAGDFDLRRSAGYSSRAGCTGCSSSRFSTSGDIRLMRYGPGSVRGTVSDFIEYLVNVSVNIRRVVEEFIASHPMRGAGRTEKPVTAAVQVSA
jgi:hypothetical protein